MAVTKAIAIAVANATRDAITYRDAITNIVTITNAVVAITILNLCIITFRIYVPDLFILPPLPCNPTHHSTALPECLIVVWLFLPLHLH